MKKENTLNVKIIPKIKDDHWLLGNAKLYLEDSVGFLKKCIEQHNDIFMFRTAHKNIIFLHHPDHIQHVLKTNHRNYRNHFAYRVLKILFGEGLVTIDGEQWRKERRLMQPHFRKDAVDSYFNKINQIAKNNVADWSNKDVWLFSEMGKITLEIISDCTLGGSVANASEVIKENSPYALEVLMGRIQSPMQLPIWFPTARHRKYSRCVKNLENLVFDIIKNTEESGAGNDLISMFLLKAKEGEKITRQHIFDEVITTLIAGHESTSIASYVLIRNVLENEEIKQKVIDEFEQVTQGKDLVIDHLPQLEYINKVIQEALRISAPAWAFAREAIDDDCINGYPIKKKDSIVISPYLVHRNIDFWLEPDSFNPDRFNTPPKHKYAYIPYGAGPKNCIGASLANMELQVMLYHIIQAGFRADPSSVPFEDTEFYTTSLTMKPRTDVMLLPSH